MSGADVLDAHAPLIASTYAIAHAPDKLRALEASPRGEATAVAAAPFACDVCAFTPFTPCLTPGFCQACRIDDARMRPPRTTELRSRPTPRSTIEAITWCVHERGPQALHEPGNIERLSRCDDAAIAEIDARLKKLEGDHAPAR